eukprot:gene6744-3315_t
MVWRAPKFWAAVCDNAKKKHPDKGMPPREEVKDEVKGDGKEEAQEGEKEEVKQETKDGDAAACSGTALDKIKEADEGANQLARRKLAFATQAVLVIADLVFAAVWPLNWA